MSFNSDMHPRNPYKDNPPDFKSLAIKYPTLRKHCTLGQNGRIHINFREDEAIRALTHAIFHNDFGLNVDLSSGCLVPRIPQKLNYLLLLEDLLQLNNLTERVNGIDIGTGASCVYPLLGAKRFDWNFVGTDVNPHSIEIASKNVSQNSLEQCIETQLVEEDTFFQGVMEKHPDRVFEFSMCNPPFFEQEETYERFPVQLSPGKFCNLPDYGATTSRPPPRSSTVAKVNELETSGGEESFVLKMIEESIVYKEKISIFTSMLGKKTSLKPLMQRLHDLPDVKCKNFVLYQGRTHRWVIAWTFRPNIRLERVSFLLNFSNILISEGRNATDVILNELRKLKIDIIKVNSKYVCKSACCTWLNLRRKRRLMATNDDHPKSKRVVGVADGSHNDVKTNELCLSDDDQTKESFHLQFELLLTESSAEFELLQGSKESLNQLMTCVRSRISK
ncbi:unnamed protein product [Auanema sp. JU1783]|nr:unnamed protein product [Auanema sp. JU1783]